MGCDVRMRWYINLAKGRPRRVSQRRRRVGENEPRRHPSHQHAQRERQPDARIQVAGEAEALRHGRDALLRGSPEGAAPRRASRAVARHQDLEPLLHEGAGAHPPAVLLRPGLRPQLCEARERAQHLRRRDQPRPLATPGRGTRGRDAPGRTIMKLWSKFEAYLSVEMNRNNLIPVRITVVSALLDRRQLPGTGVGLRRVRQRQAREHDRRPLRRQRGALRANGHQSGTRLLNFYRLTFLKDNPKYHHSKQPHTSQ